MIKERISIAGLYGQEFPQLLLDNLEAAVYVCDAEGYVLLYNSAAADLWGREPEIGKDLWCGSWKLYETDGITPVSLDECPMAILLKEGRTVDAREVIIERPNGLRSNVIPYPKALLDREGNVLGAVNLLVDVSGHKRHEQKEARLAAIVESSDDAIIGKTLDGIITSWNAGAWKIFGYSAHEMIGQPLLKLIPADRWEEEYHIQEQLRKGNKIDHYETKRIAKDGSTLDVSLTISPIRDTKGNIIGASKIARDITRQKINESALRESEERFRLAVQMASIGTWAFDPVSLNIVCSMECRRAFNFPDNLPLDYNVIKNQVYPDDLTLVYKKLGKVFDQANEGDYDVEHRIIPFGQGDVRWLRMRGKMYFNAEGRPEKLIGTLLDITDEKTAKEQLERTVHERTEDLQKTNEQLRRSNHDLEQFAYIASHDLQEPLRKIQSFIDFIKRTDDKEAMSGYFDKIGHSAQRMSTLIKDVLNYSLLEKNETLLGQVDLNHVLSDVKVDYESLIAEKCARIESTELPVIRGIYSQLRQLFANLIGNALKFSAANPKISIAARIIPPLEMDGYPELEAGKQHVELTFSDNGIGFDKKYAEQIFTIFQRLHNRWEYDGTGIGLALCKKIVENHRGHIKGEGQSGVGAVFTVTLPH